MTKKELDIGKSVRNKNLKELQNGAPYLCASFLQQRRKAAIARGGLEKATALLEMIKKERENKRWRRMRNVVGKKRG